MLATGVKNAVDFILSSGNAHDAPHGRLLLETVGRQKQVKPLIMDRYTCPPGQQAKLARGAYEDDKTQYTAAMLGFSPVAPPKSNRKEPWEYDKELYKLRNEIERLFRLIQGFRRVFCRFDKLDAVYIGIIQLAFVFIEIR
jgi:transposase